MLSDDEDDDDDWQPLRALQSHSLEYYNHKDIQDTKLFLNQSLNVVHSLVDPPLMHDASYSLLFSQYNWLLKSQWQMRRAPALVML
jgi:hypothetical protein